MPHAHVKKSASVDDDAAKSANLNRLGGLRVVKNYSTSMCDMSSLVYIG